MPVAKQDRRSKRIHREEHEKWNSMRCRNGTMNYFNATSGGVVNRTGYYTPQA